MSNFSRYIWVAYFALFFGGCNLHADLDSVHYLGSGADANETPDLGDAQSEADGEDGADTVSDTISAADIQSGDSGEDAEGPDVIANACDIIHQDDCGDAMSCIFDNEEGRTRCVLSAGLAETAGSAQGEACASYEDCLGGLICVEWALPDPRGAVCSRPCAPGAGSLCEANQFCATSPLAFAGDLGFCTAKCDVMNPGATCDEAQRCVPDPFQPGAAFGSNFRCLQNYDGNRAHPEDPPKSMSATCSAANLHENGCPADLTCLPVTVNGSRAEHCLEPCVNGDASECSYFQSLNTCTSIPESSGTGYCSMT